MQNQIEIPEDDYDRLSRACQAYAELKELLGDSSQAELQNNRLLILASCKLVDVITCNLTKIFVRHRLVLLDWNVIVGMRAHVSRAKCTPDAEAFWMLLTRILPDLMQSVEETYGNCTPVPINGSDRESSQPVVLCASDEDEGKYRRLFRRALKKETGPANTYSFFPSTLSSLCNPNDRVAGRFRTETELWYRRLSQEHRALLYGRLRKSDNLLHVPAFYELFFHEYFRARSFEIEVEPEVSTYRPDFLISRAKVKFYLEVKTIWDEVDLPQHKLAVEHVLRSLDELHCNCFLAVDFAEIPREVNIKPFLSEVRNWLSTQGVNGSVQNKITIQDFGVNCTIEAVASDDLVSSGNVFRWSTPELGRDQSEHAVHKALRKNLKFATFVNEPVILAVCMHESVAWDEIEICRQLFGDVEITSSRDGSRSVKLKHAGRGFSANKNTRISTMIFCTQRINRGRRIHELKAFHNPWASSPLPEEVLADMPQLLPSVDEPTGLLQWKYPG